MWVEEGNTGKIKSTNTHIHINQQQQPVSGETASWEDVCADFFKVVFYVINGFVINRIELIVESLIIILWIIQLFEKFRIIREIYAYTRIINFSATSNISNKSNHYVK